MGQKTRMAKIRAATPVSRDEYRRLRKRRLEYVAERKAMLVRDGVIPPDPTDNAGGRARFAAKHSGHPLPTYAETNVGGYTGPKTAKPRPPVRIDRCIPMRKIDGEWRPI